MIKEKVGEEHLLIENIQKIGIKDLDKFYLEDSISWKLAIIKKLNKFSANIETEDKLDGKIQSSKIFLGQKKNLINY